MEYKKFQEVLFCSVGSFAIIKHTDTLNNKNIVFEDYKEGQRMFAAGSLPIPTYSYGITENMLIAYVLVINMFIDKIISIEEMYNQLNKVYNSKFI